MKKIEIKQYGFPDAILYSYKYPKAEELNPILQEVIIFPGWLIHHVPANKGEGRSVISGNLSYIK